MQPDQYNCPSSSPLGGCSHLLETASELLLFLHHLEDLYILQRTTLPCVCCSRESLGQLRLALSSVVRLLTSYLASRLLIYRMVIGSLEGLSIPKVKSGLRRKRACCTVGWSSHHLPEAFWNQTLGAHHEEGPARSALGQDLASKEHEMGWDNRYLEDDC